MSHTLSPREKKLAWIVGTAAFIFTNYLVIEWAWRQHDQLQASIVSQKKQLLLIESLFGNSDFWNKRESWLQSQQPHLDNPDTAAVQLLDLVKAVAKGQEVLVENPVIRVPERQPEYISVSVEVETKSTWAPLVHFLYELQRGAQFIAVESANLKIDPTDPTQVRGRFRIARWYASR
jgi:hypothetical protein